MKNNFLKSALIFIFSVSLALAVLFPSRGVDATADGVAIRLKAKAWYSVWDGSVAASFAGGDGTEANPYQISNGKELAYLASVVNNSADDTVNGGKFNQSDKYYKLTSHIALNGTVINEPGSTEDLADWSVNPPANEWTPIGVYIGDGDLSKAFCANFDGDGCTVRGIYIVYINTTDDNQSQGLFGCVYGGAIKNIGIEQSYIKGVNCVGGVVGCLLDGSIMNCYNTGSISNTGSNLGGVVGIVGGTASEDVVYEGRVTNCYNTGVVVGNGGVGGVVGSAIGNITNCYNTGNVSGVKDHVGGIVGFFCGNATNCYNTGNISSTGNYIGSIVGYVLSDVIGDITYGGNVTNCYYLTDTATSGIGENNGGTVTNILKFNTSGVFEGNEINSVTINETQYGNLLDALNAWVETNQTNPEIYSIWYGTPYPTFTENNDGGTGGGKGCNSANSTNAALLFPALIVMLGVCLVRGKR